MSANIFHLMEPKIGELMIDNIELNLSYSISLILSNENKTCTKNECQIRNKAAQHNHITHVFLAYSLSQLIRKNKKLKNAEFAIRSIKVKNCANINFAKPCVEQHFGSLYV